MCGRYKAPERDITAIPSPLAVSELLCRVAGGTGQIQTTLPLDVKAALSLPYRVNGGIMSSDDDRNDIDVGNPDGGTGLKTKRKPKIKEPDMYRVLLINDDYTPREFVVEVLQKVFRKSLSEAYKVMMRAHRGGHSTVSVYTYDIAMTKANQAKKMAREADYPLQFAVEPDK